MNLTLDERLAHARGAARFWCMMFFLFVIGAAFVLGVNLHRDFEWMRSMTPPAMQGR